MQSSKNAFVRAWEYSLSRPWISVSLLGVALLASISLLPRLTFIVSADDMVTEGFRTYAPLQELHRLFHEENELFFILHPDPRRPLTGAEYCAARNALARVLAESDSTEGIYSPLSIRKAKFDHGKLLFPTILEPDCGSSSPLMPVQNPWIGSFLAPDGADFPFLIFAKPSSSRKFGGFDPIGVDRIIQTTRLAIEERFSDTATTHWKLETTGAGAYQHEVYRGFSQLAALNLALLACILLFGRVFWGTWAAPLLLTLTLLLNGTLLYGLMAAFKIPVDILNSNVFILVAVATAEDFVFLALLLFQGVPARQAFRKLVTPSFFTSLSTFIGFASLYVSEIPAIRSFGLIAATGAMLEWFLVFFILPIMMDRPRIKLVLVNEKNALGSRWAGRFSGGLPLSRLCSRAALVVFPIAAYAVFHLHYLDRPDRTFPDGNPFSRTYQYLRETRGTATIADVLIAPKMPREAVARMKASLLREPEVHGVEDADEILSFTLEDLPPRLRESLEGNGEGNPLVTEALQRYISDSGTRRWIIYFKSAAIEDVNRLKDKYETEFCQGDCRWTGTSIAYAEFGDRIRLTLLKSLGMSLLLVAILLFILIRALKVRSILAVFASSFWSPAVMLTGIWLFHVPVFFITCIFASVLVGLTGDCCIQFMFYSRGRDLDLGAQALGPASLIVMLLMALLSLVFLSSYFSPPRILGGLLSVAFMVSFVGDYWILRGLCRSQPPSNSKRAV